MACTSSPKPGASITSVVCAVEAIATSAWPTPTVSTMMRSKPATSSSVTTSPVVLLSPPRLPRVAMLRMKTPGSPLSARMRTRSPKIAPPVKGLVGSIATIATRSPAARRCWAKTVTNVDLPVPGAPVTPMMWARPPAG